MQEEKTQFSCLIVFGGLAAPDEKWGVGGLGLEEVYIEDTQEHCLSSGRITQLKKIRASSMDKTFKMLNSHKIRTPHSILCSRDCHSSGSRLDLA